TQTPHDGGRKPMIAPEMRRQRCKLWRSATVYGPALGVHLRLNGLDRANADDLDSHRFRLCAVIVMETSRLEHETSLFDGDHLVRLEHVPLARPPGALDDRHVAIPGVIVRPARLARQEGGAVHIRAGLRFVAEDEDATPIHARLFRLQAQMVHVDQWL